MTTPVEVLLIYVPVVMKGCVPPVNAGIDVLLAEGYTEADAFVWGKFRTMLSKSSLKRGMVERSN